MSIGIKIQTFRKKKRIHLMAWGRIISGIIFIYSVVLSRIIGTSYYHTGRGVIACCTGRRCVAPVVTLRYCPCYRLYSSSCVGRILSNEWCNLFLLIFTFYKKIFSIPIVRQRTTRKSALVGNILTNTFNGILPSVCWRLDEDPPQPFRCRIHSRSLRPPQGGRKIISS